MTSRFSCCEVCDRNPTCGVDCGSCEGTPEDWKAAYIESQADLYRATTALEEIQRFVEKTDGSSWIWARAQAVLSRRTENEGSA